MKKSALFDALRAGILDLSLSPGSALDEAALCESYGVSRTPLREVLQRLSGEGYVTLEANRGAAVSSMDLDTMRNFFQTAPMIYAAVARLAAEGATPARIAALKDIQQGFREAVAASAPRDMAVLNHQFHETIGDMAGSPYLTPSLKRLLIDHTRMSQTFYAARDTVEQGQIATACDQHDAMIEAFEQRAPARAVELTLEHWALSRDRMERFARPDPLPLDPAGDMRNAV